MSRDEQLVEHAALSALTLHAGWEFFLAELDRLEASAVDKMIRFENVTVAADAAAEVRALRKIRRWAPGRVESLTRQLEEEQTDG